MEHSFPFDPTNGLTQEELLQIPTPEEPENFRSFWEETCHLTRSHTPCWHIEKEIWSGDPSIRTYQIKAKTWDNREIVMWISRPEHSKGGLLIGQGYGNPATPLTDPDLTVCYPCIRGLGHSQCKDIPWEAAKHVLWGITSKETYILRGAVTDLWTAATVLLDMFPDTGENLNYSGASMGGGMGALMLPWDDRFHSGYLHVPSFGGNPFRLRYESRGSGEAVRKYILEHPEAGNILQYFDAAIGAKYIRKPVILLPALFDPVVAPVGQFCVCNAIPQKYKKLFIVETGHYAATDKCREVMSKADSLKRKLFLSSPSEKSLM